MSRTLHPAVAELLASRRLAELEHGSARHRFTVSREEGLLQLREQSRARGDGVWEWTVFAVRAANALSPLAEARIAVERLEAKPEALQLVTIDIITPGFEFDGLDLSDLLGGALAPDIGLPLPDPRESEGGEGEGGEGEGGEGEGGEGEGEEEDEGEVLARRDVERAQCLTRFRALIGRALNLALAHEPLSVELETPAGGRAFERREQAVEGRDAYVERKRSACETSSRFVLRLTRTQPGISSRIGRWLRRRGEVGEELIKLWGERRLQERSDDGGVPDDEGALSLGPALAAKPVAFGKLARYGHLAVRGEQVPEALRSCVWLVREGVKLIDIGPALASLGLDPVALAGWIEAPRLRLTADERGVVRDTNFETLVAWLHDYRGRVGALGELVWPSSLPEGVTAASGAVITTDELAEAALRGRELVYVWRHQVATTPAWARSRIAALWPVEELLLRERLPELRLVPAHALGQTNTDPEDLTSLRQGCFEPIGLVKQRAVLDEDELRPGAQAQPHAQLHIDVEAFVHRAPTANQGFIEILAYERRVTKIYEPGQVFPGVTLICRVSSEGSPLSIEALRKDHATIAKIAERCRSETRHHWEALVSHVMSQANAWENPMLHTALLELDASALELRYHHSEVGLRLAWRDSVLLDVELGATLTGERRCLRDGLRTARERGFILVAHRHKRYGPLRSKDPLLQPWIFDHHNARGLLARIVGAAALLDMPVVPEAHPLVLDEPVDDQRHLLREPATLERERGKASTDPLARQRLLGHLLVARGLGSATTGLESLPLLERYDPRAQHPARLVSLEFIEGERPRPGLVPAGSVHRGLARPMLEVLPGVAALLAEVVELTPGLTSPAVKSERPLLDVRGVERSAATPVRRRGRSLPPLLARAVRDPLLFGRLEVAGDLGQTGIGLWSGGLRVGELVLHKPLELVHGRLVLTPQGQRVGASKVRAAATAHARELLADAPHQRSLLPPGQPQRDSLEHFITYVREFLREGEDHYELAEVYGLRTSVDSAARLVALRQMSLRAAPLRPLGAGRDALLANIVRQSLAMAVHFDTAMLSWRPAKIERRRDGSFEIEFGLRNTWIQRGLDEDRELDLASHHSAALVAGLFVIAAFFEQASARDDTKLGYEHLHVALWRLLELGSK